MDATMTQDNPYAAAGLDKETRRRLNDDKIERMIRRTALEYDPEVATTLKKLKDALDLARAALLEVQASLS
jgi:hypothetical protein